jgi:hypothetical protein
VKGDKRGRALRGRHSFFGEEDFGFWGRKHFGGGREHWFHGLVFLVLWESFSDCEYHCRGHRVARGFGHGGQDSFRFPGAREPDRLLLAGWVDSRFGQCWSVHRARQDNSKSAGKGQPYRRELASETGIYM